MRVWIVLVSPSSYINGTNEQLKGKNDCTRQAIQPRRSSGSDERARCLSKESARPTARKYGRKGARTAKPRPRPTTSLRLASPGFRRNLTLLLKPPSSLSSPLPDPVCVPHHFKLFLSDSRVMPTDSTTREERHQQNMFQVGVTV